jgi:hypothetical protein
MVKRVVAGGLALLALYLFLLVALLMVGRHVTLPDENQGMSPSGGSLGALAHMLVGRPVGTDFLGDYGGAYALLHGHDAYAPIAETSRLAGAPWDANTVNTHPPMLVALVIPLTAVGYGAALAAWALAMIFILVATLYLVGVPLRWSVAGGLALALVWPAAYGVGNPVPLIGFGAALAWRFRDTPIVAGLGLALAISPKASGAGLVLPFLLTRRFRPALWGGVFVAALGAFPLLFDHKVWSRYMDTGVKAIEGNANRGDNGAPIHVLNNFGVPTVAGFALLGFLMVVLMVATKDGYWPVVWFTVAALPIAWMYSLLTLLPAMAWVLRRKVVWPAVAAGVLTMASSPAGRWPVLIIPIVVALSWIALLTSGLEPEGFPLPLPLGRRAELGSTVDETEALAPVGA